MKTVLVLSFSDLSRDPRVNRQIRVLRERYRVVAAGHVDPDVPGVEFIAVERRATRSLVRRALSAVALLAGLHERYYWSLGSVRHCLQALTDLRPDLIIANDLATLPVALTLARGAKVVFDAHEYSPRQFEDRLLFRMFFQRYATDLCRRYIPAADAMTTIGECIGAAYSELTGVEPVVVTNAAEYEALRPDDGGDAIRLVHHGNANPSRRLETMIEAMSFLDERFELDLLLVPADVTYVEHLEEVARDDPRIRFRPPVPMRELPRVLNRYDVGLCFFPPTTFNLKHALPNKFFEYVQARVAVASGPSPEMARLIDRHGLGIVTEDFDPRSLARSLSRLRRAEIQSYKARAHESARALSAERNASVLLDLVRSVLAA